jgi:cell division protein FtsB
VSVFGDKGLISIHKLKNIKSQKAQKIDSLLKENAHLKQKITLMETDENEIRSEILKTFGMIGEGEILFELKSDSG